MTNRAYPSPRLQRGLAAAAVALLARGQAYGQAVSGPMAMPAPATAAATAASAAASTVASKAASTAASTTADRAPAPLRELVQRAAAALRTEPATLYALTGQALALLAQHPDADLEAQVRVLRCDYFNERDRAAAWHEIARLRELAPRLRNPGLRAAALGCEGELHEQSGNNTQAMALYEQAVTVAEGARDERRLAEVLYLRGYLRGVLGDFAPGLADLRRSLALYEKARLPVEMRTTTNAVASLYNRMGALDEARRYYEESLRSMPEGVATRERVIAQHNLGRNHKRAGRWDEAQRQFEQVLAMARELDYLRGQVHALRGLAAVRNARGDGAHALQLVEESQRLYGQVPDEPLRARVLLQRAFSLRQLQRPADALPALREAIRVFAAGDAVMEEAEAREELARCSAELGEWRQAYEQQSRARRITEEMLRRQIDYRFATMKVQFDADARERELVMLQRENAAGERALAEQRRAAWLQIVAALLASALALALGAFAWRQRRTGHRMRALAMTDELTGLPNRRSALAALERVLQARQGGAVLIMDIDHFKRINDAHGHAVGDAVLRAACAAWREAAGAGVGFGRLGGEEFIAVLSAGGTREAMALAERLRAAIGAGDPGTGLPRVTTSIGVTALVPGDTVAGALARADEALYRAKEGGRNRVESRP